MRKEFVVMRIDAAPDGAPHVVVSLSLAKDMKEGNQPPSPFGTNVMGFTNMDDMMKNLNKMMACLLYTSPSPRDATLSRMPSSA